MNEQEPKIEIQESLPDKIVRLRKEAFRKAGVPSHDMIHVFVGKLREKYPNWQKYFAYHVLAGSAPSDKDKEGMVYEDFPGEDSVVGFLESIKK